MGRAATSLHMTQPAVSHLLQQLEAKLEVKLFDRRPRGMEPTIYGDVMIRYAKSVIHDFERAEAEIAELSRGASGLVRIGSVIEPVPLLLTQSLLVFKAEACELKNILLDIEDCFPCLCAVIDCKNGVRIDILPVVNTLESD